MCGRYVSPEQAAIERAWHIGRHNNKNPFVERFNVSPTSTIPLLRLAPESGELELVPAIWGLIPVWWKELKPPRFTFNARCEEAATKPMWRSPLQSGRCLVPAVGWYEWQAIERVDPATGEVKPAKQPHFIHSKDGKLVTFAGILSQQRGANDGPPIISCAFLTGPAAPTVSAVHDRMPVVLPDGAHVAWLDPKLKDGAQAIALAREQAETDFEHYAVNSRVNMAKNDDAALMNRIE